MAVASLRRPLTERLDNLPLQLASFVGREAELSQVRSLLASERLLTLTGIGGIGKTRLAIEAALTSRGSYQHGVWLVDLSALGEPALVLQAVAEAVGVRAEAEAPLQQTLIDVLRARRVLLVLDNCEHLVEACAGLAEAVLSTCAEVRVLATSREPLRAAGEVVWRVPPMALPAATARLSQRRVAQFGAVRLFVERASAASGFDLTDANASAALRVCQRLDGLPLAIELAAARTGILSVEQMAERLDDRFQLLVNGRRMAHARQRTLRTMLDWSYDLLAEGERTLFRRLSVFAAGWSLDAAERVCSGDEIASGDVLGLLGQLVDKSLVQNDGESRFRMLESVRHYARERMRAEDANRERALQRRFAEYCRDLALDVEAQIQWGPGDVDWLKRLDPELGNLRAAITWSFSEAGDLEIGLQLVGHLGHYWYTRGDRAEGRAWLRAALARVDVAPGEATSALAWAVLWAGGLAHGQSDYDAAVPLLERALELFNQLDDVQGAGWAVSFLGHVARARADLPRAVEFLERAVAAFRDIGDELSTILPLSALGFTVGALGDADRATCLLEASVALARRTGSRGRLALVSIYYGQVAYALGEVSRAVAAWREGLQLSHEWDSRWSMAECLEGLALAAGSEGQPGRAARLLGAAARLRQSIGAPVHPVDRADHERTLTMVRGALGEDALAAAWSAGLAMSPEDAVAYAGSNARRTPGRRSRGPAGLSAREVEVALLIARGLSNREIANSLVIAERTAVNHVEHILDKLGFRSRAQIAAWATEQRLADTATGG